VFGAGRHQRQHFRKKLKPLRLGAYSLNPMPSCFMKSVTLATPHFMNSKSRLKRTLLMA
jgi:hypothetical protein